MRRRFCQIVLLSLVVSSCVGARNRMDSETSPSVRRGVAMESGPSQGVLRVGTIGDITAMDPHYSFMDLNFQVQDMIYERLVDFGPKKELIPQLARDWKVSAKDPTLWTFDLVKGVRFQHGQPFTKADVLCTLDRVMEYAQHSPSGYAGQLGAFDLKKTKAANLKDSDPYRLRLVTKEPYGFVASNLGSLLIMSCDDAREAMRIDAKDPQGVGKPFSPATLAAFASGRLVNGTGPYIFKSWTPYAKNPDASRVVVEPNPNYWAKSGQEWKKIEVIGEPDDNKRVNRLLNGEFDVIANVPNPRVDDIRKNGFSIVTTPSLRMVHLQLYQTDDGRQTNPLHVPMMDDQGNKYPLVFANILIRKAFADAIDKSRLVRVMNGQAIPTGQFMLSEVPVGHMSDIPDNDYDVSKARDLIAKASHNPKYRFLQNRHLTITLNGPDGRYPNDAKVLAEVATMWNEAFGSFDRDGVHYSIKAVARTESVQDFFSHVNKYNVLLLGGGIDNGHPEGALRLYLLPKGPRTSSPLNFGNYSNPAVTSAYLKGVAITDKAARDQAITAALRIATQDEAVIPLYNQMGVWALRPGLKLTPRMDELTMPQRVTMEH